MIVLDLEGRRTGAQDTLEMLDNIPGIKSRHPILLLDAKITTVQPVGYSAVLAATTRFDVRNRAAFGYSLMYFCCHSALPQSPSA
jgi:hypothetical protein